VKIAISSTGPTLDAPVDPRFGRSVSFLVIDMADGSFVAMDNGGQHSPQGAGIQAAEALARIGVAAVITGHCGPKAFEVLTAAGIQLFVGAEGTVAGALERFRSGKWKASNGADVNGHWA
jgi:predicted Fe-Mo cluster-binding NifX family protein